MARCEYCNLYMAPLEPSVEVRIFGERQRYHAEPQKAGEPSCWQRMIVAWAGVIDELPRLSVSGRRRVVVVGTSRPRQSIHSD